MNPWLAIPLCSFPSERLWLEEWGWVWQGKWSAFHGHAINQLISLFSDTSTLRAWTCAFKEGVSRGVKSFPDAEVVCNDSVCGAHIFQGDMCLKLGSSHLTYPGPQSSPLN